jgi:ribonuclease R
VNELVSHNNPSEQLENLKSHLFEFYNLFKKLLSQREIRGAIEFETVETKIIFDDAGKISKIVPVVRVVSHRMIEEAMLIANVCAARFLEKNNIPVLYRIHDTPTSEKLTALREFLKPFGLRLTGGQEPKPSDYGRLLERIKKRPDFTLIQTMMLRSLPQAVYSPENVGHFGLAFDHYAHFTSPIRRYPDLIVHRAIKHLLHKNKQKTFPYNEIGMQELGSHCSVTERRADEATRDAVDWLKCEFMLNKVGQTFDGHIVEVMAFGAFIELKEIYVQGLLHITALANDYYHYDAKLRMLKGKYSGTTYRLGDSIRILVARVSLDQRQIDFELAEGGGVAAATGEKPKAKEQTPSDKKKRKRKHKSKHKRKDF